MAEFTMKLKDVIDSTGGDIGLSDYPIFSDNHRPILNQKIIDHYWNQEIGQEDVEMFTFAMRRKMNEIMPRYNQLYKSELLQFDPLLTMGLQTTGESETEQENTAKVEGKESTLSNGTQLSKADSSGRTVAMDTPQNALEGNADYASGAQDSISHTDSDSSSTGKSEGDSSTDSTINGKVSGTNKQEVTGFSGSQSVLLQQFRETILNIDLEIIAELQELFMQVWWSGDSFTQRNHIGYSGRFFPFFRF